MIIINTRTSDNTVPKYRKLDRIGMQGETDNLMIAFRNFHTPFSIIDRTTKKINKEIEDRRNTIRN